ncbi:relaxase [Chimaeribacter californicus]|uniref:Relaxase n=1 Tax=Chimaeribacter californicus TaxID=2060067 RepID=A0A2N5E2W3_9GAMM|nr:TraI domain-containing protein [Chimaeribacter californicus]PLR35021.1 relaxase [Chimaeribacter californicus]
MLKRLLRLGRERLTVVDISVANTQIAPPGYHLPLTPAELLAPVKRQQWLQTLWDYSSLPKEMYHQFYLVPLERCITLMQQFPLSESGHHAGLGGMADYMLESTAYAIRLSKSYMLPVGAPPEEQAEQSAAWNAVVVYAAMLSSLAHLCHLEVELANGKCWVPLREPPAEPYRFRFVPETSPERVQSFAAMLAWQILPEAAITWLSTWPDAIKTLSTYLTGFHTQSGVVNAIISEAVQVARGEVETQHSSHPQNIVDDILIESPVSQEISHIEPLENGDIAKVSEENITDVNTLSLEPSEDDTEGLLSVLGYNTNTDASAETKHSSSNREMGEAFWQWLTEGCETGKITVNTSQSYVHLIAGFVFIQTPKVFHQYLSDSGVTDVSKSTLQKAFERLGHHRQDEKALYTGHLYENEQREGRFKKLNGYLILVNKVYKSTHVPKENPLLIIHQGRG